MHVPISVDITITEDPYSYHYAERRTELSSSSQNCVSLTLLDEKSNIGTRRQQERLPHQAAFYLRIDHIIRLLVSIS